MSYPRILVLGGSGMLGGSIFRYLSEQKSYHVRGTVRSDRILKYFQDRGFENMVPNVDVMVFDSLMEEVTSFKPDIIINCVGVVKQMSASQSHAVSRE